MHYPANQISGANGGERRSRADVVERVAVAIERAFALAMRPDLK
jgi:hypothetical protein